MIEKEIKDALTNWQKIIKKYQEPNSVKAVIQMLNSFLPFIGLWVLMYFSLSWSYWITLLLALVTAFFLVRVFIIQHDCGHQSFFKSKWLNVWVGYFCSFFSTIPFKYWASVHNIHHGHNGQHEFRDLGDINYLTIKEYEEKTFWGKLGYRIFRSPIVMFFITPMVYLIWYLRFPFVRMQGWGKVKRSNFINNLMVALVYGTIGYFIGWKKFILVQFPIVYLFGMIAFWFFYIQHQHEESYKTWKDNWDYLLASIKGSTFYNLPKMFHWLSGNIGYHHIHHLNSRIPNYNLEKCAKENPILSKYVTSVTFWESLKMVKYKLWDEESNRMISFREFRELKKSA